MSKHRARWFLVIIPSGILVLILATFLYDSAGLEYRRFDDHGLFAKSVSEKGEEFCGVFSDPLPGMRTNATLFVIPCRIYPDLQDGTLLFAVTRISRNMKFQYKDGTELELK